VKARDIPDEETSDWRAVCGRTARTVRRAGRVNTSPPITVGWVGPWAIVHPIALRAVPGALDGSKVMIGRRYEAHSIADVA